MLLLHNVSVNTYTSLVSEAEPFPFCFLLDVFVLDTQKVGNLQAGVLETERGEILCRTAVIYVHVRTGVQGPIIIQCIAFVTNVTAFYSL